MAFKSYKSAIDENWGTSDPTVNNPDDIKLTIEQINIGCMLSIADSMKAMATNHVRLQNDYDYMRKERDRYRSKSESLENKIRTMKGVITKLKKKCN